MERPEVAAALDAPSARHAGFNLVIGPQAVPAGSYQVLGLIDQRHAAELRDMQRQLTLGTPGAP